MILVDASVLIQFLRTKDPGIDKLLRSEPVAVCGVTRAEVLAGARSPADRQRLISFLQNFQQVTLPDSLWDQIGDSLAALYAKGLSIPIADVALATLAIANDIEVWARDPHFPTMQTILPALKLFQEPP